MNTISIPNKKDIKFAVEKAVKVYDLDNTLEIKNLYSRIKILEERIKILESKK